jgi:hypothetical protein
LNNFKNRVMFYILRNILSNIIVIMFDKL